VICLLLASASANLPQTRTRRIAVNSAPSPASEITEIKDGEVLRTETALVVLPVSVKDREGRAISDLKKEDFRIYETGIEQEVAYFAPVDEAFTVVLMLDTSSSVWKSFDKIKDAAARFVGHLKSEDRVMVISFAHRMTIHCEPTNDRERLLKVIHGIGKGMSTHLYAAVQDVMKNQLGKIKGRKAVVLFTDGVDESGEQTARQTVHYAEELDALVYTIRFDTYDQKLDAMMQAQRAISLGGLLPPLLAPPSSAGKPESLSEAYERGERFLHDLAGVTGGNYFEANHNLRDLDQAFTQIAEHLSHQYSLGYYPRPRGRPGERRYVRVRVERSGVAVHSRGTYILKAESAGEKTKRLD
jgi:VWFA-related protein